MIPDLDFLPDGCSLRFILIRHGEPTASTRGRCHGKLDVELSETGREQMRHALERLSNLRADAIYTSPLRRALDSAAIVNRRLQLQLRVSPQLEEINFGAFEGLRYEEIEELYPNAYKSWMKNPSSMTFPDGESFAQMKKRVLCFKESLVFMHRRQTLVIVSHGGTNRIILGQALEIPDRQLFRLDQTYGGISIIDYFSDCALVRLING